MQHCRLVIYVVLYVKLLASKDVQSLNCSIAHFVNIGNCR